MQEKLHFLTRSFHTLLKNQVFSRPLKDKNWMKLCRLSGYKILEDGSGSDEDDMLPDSLILRKNFARMEFSLSKSPATFLNSKSANSKKEKSEEGKWKTISVAL